MKHCPPPSQAEGRQQINGTKTLISYNYYDEQTFWSI